MATAERTLAASLGREATVAELADATELSVDEITELRSLGQAPLSLDLLVGHEGDTPLIELVRHDVAAPEQGLEHADRATAVRRAVAVLSPKQRHVIELRFGSEARSFSQVGRMVGLSAERARQVEERALRELAANPELIALRAIA